MTAWRAAGTFMVVLLLAGLFTLAAVGQGEQDDAAAEDRGVRKIVTTTAMLADAARAVAGAGWEVESLMGQGVDPHLYHATRSDMKKLLQADLVFYHGANLEGKMGQALAEVGERVMSVSINLSLLRDPQIELLGADGHSGHDPHIWMDPIRWAHAVGVIRNTLVEVDSENSREYALNAGEYNRLLKRMNWYAEQVLATVPEEHRVLVTAHDAFRYFADRYGFEVIGIQGISTDSEAGLADIERIVDILVKRKIPAVFVETTVSERNVKALIAGAAAQGHEVHIGGELFSDAMGAPGTYEGTYLGMIDHNVTTIARSLGGQAPERGLDKKLSAITPALNGAAGATQPDGAPPAEESDQPAPAADDADQR